MIFKIKIFIIENYQLYELYTKCVLIEPVVMVVRSFHNSIVMCLDMRTGFHANIKADFLPSDDSCTH